MKIWNAVTLAPLTLTHWQTDKPHVFPAGTAVTAVVWPPLIRCHLNAEFEGETYTGYTPADTLEIGDAAATVNEG